MANEKKKEERNENIKASPVTLSNHVVEVKVDLEKEKLQIQNCALFYEAFIRLRLEADSEREGTVTLGKTILKSVVLYP